MCIFLVDFWFILWYTIFIEYRYRKTNTRSPV
nr:MAG TPA: hypothetical protein [Caudoviricetes sp.]